jgi:hypothetical protein
MFSSDAVPLHMLTRDALRCTSRGLVRMAPSPSIFPTGTWNWPTLSRRRPPTTWWPWSIWTATDETIERDLSFAMEIVLVAQSDADLALKLGPDWHVIRPAADVRVSDRRLFQVLDAILTKIRGSSSLRDGM